MQREDRAGLEASVKTVSTLLYSYLHSSGCIGCGAPGQHPTSARHVCLASTTGIGRNVRASQRHARNLSAFGTQFTAIQHACLRGKHPRCLWQPLPLPLSGEGSGANLSIRTTGTSRKSYRRHSLQLNPEFLRSKYSRCVSVPLGRKALTPHSAPTAGSQGKTDDTPSISLWQAEPWTCNCTT